jgi:hypothetical protein
MLISGGGAARRVIGERRFFLPTISHLSLFTWERTG